MIFFSIAAGFLLGLLAALTAARVSQRLRPEPTCTTCSTMTNWPIRGHDDRGCPNYWRDVSASPAARDGAQPHPE
ncbi:hypothetical protein [Streptomyces fulvoviolaceus]|uniref:hypothetical protein n=1 Tax=Streptomyces fulvoviolaceus TaxID=285535 RepID=UPI0004C76F79|nr:hypothetical protein [Streptomyces fulvoviolaceus]